MITGFDHIQIAIPAGGEERARAFYRDLLEMTEQAKPPVLAARGGCWFSSGTAVVHLGIETPFVPARKAHPAFVVTDLELARGRLTDAGHNCIPGDGDRPGVRRFHTFDPFGNRLEFQQG